MKTYSSTITVSAVDLVKGRIMNGKVGIVPINVSIDQIEPGDTVVGEMFTDEFPDQNDNKKMVIMFKMIITKVRKGKKAAQTESF